MPASAQFSPGFTLGFILTNSGDITVTQGGSGSNTINVISNSILPITIVDCPDSLGLPAGATCSFSVTSAGVGSYSSVLTIFTTSATPIGSFPITVTGEETNVQGTITMTTTFLLNVLGPNGLAPPSVGGYLQPINKAEVLSMMLLEGASGYWWVLAIAAIVALAAVLLKRRES